MVTSKAVQDITTLAEKLKTGGDIPMEEIHRALMELIEAPEKDVETKVPLVLIMRIEHFYYGCKIPQPPSQAQPKTESAFSN